MGDTIGKASAGSSDSSERHKNAVLDIEAEIKLAFDSRRRSDDDSASFSQEMKDLGLERYAGAAHLSCHYSIVLGLKNHMCDQ